MTQMGIAAMAAHLGADHVMAAVLMLFDHVIGQGGVEAWPAAARFEFGRRIEERGITADATIGAGTFGKSGMAEGPLGGCPAGDLKGQIAQLRQPFGVRLGKFRHHPLLRACLAQSLA